MKRHMAAALAAALLLPALPSVAQDRAIDFSRAGRSQAYRDLPGVLSPEEVEARRQPVVCVRKHVERSLGGRWRPGEQAVYSCTYDGQTVESNQLPYSREREMRGIGW